MDTKPCDASWVEETLVNDTMNQAIKDILSKKKVYQRVVEYCASNYTLNSLYKRFKDLSEELNEVNNIKANAEGNELKGIHKEETMIKPKIQINRKDIMHLQKNASTIQTLKNLHENPNQRIPTLFYKHFFGIIIHQSGELILVLSKSHETHELLPLMNQLVKYPILLENLHIDYELKKGLNYKVLRKQKE